jgi:RNA polymerase sigma-54 factor
MALGPRLDLRQSQTLIMTPQLQQAIKLLQMSNLELTEFIEQEVESNPLLEREDAEGGLESSADQNTDIGEADGGDASGAADSYADDGPETPDSMEMTNSETLLESDAAALDTDYENVWEPDTPVGDPEAAGDSSANWSLTGAGEAVGGGSDLDNFAATELTLREHLLSQVNVDIEEAGDRIICAHLIDMLDDAGYLTGDLAQFAAMIGCELDHAERMLDQMKRCDPPGVFAADLSECLALQLADRGRLDPTMETLLENLELLAKCDFTALRKRCGISSEVLAEMIQEIKTLNPKPASDFDHTVAQPVMPDVLVRPGANGEWIVELNSETLPRVLINSRYYAVVRAKTPDKKGQAYLIDCFQSANWLVKSLQQRAQTILKVATEIVTRQKDFFDHGVQQLRPLTLHDVAEVVGVHESTVSRVTNNKFLGFPRGVFEMKYFFSSAIGQGVAGDAKSAESIRFMIKGLIEAELPDSVLSDDGIVEILSRDGVIIARRTVAKYREGMRIPSSVQRRREKALQA